MAIQVNGTEVISNSRALNNIASVDATTAAAIGAAGVGGGGEIELTAASSITAGDPVGIDETGKAKVVDLPTLKAGFEDATRKQIYSGFDSAYDASLNKLIEYRSTTTDTYRPSLYIFDLNTSTGAASYATEIRPSISYNSGNYTYQVLVASNSNGGLLLVHTDGYATTNMVLTPASINSSNSVSTGSSNAQNAERLTTGSCLTYATSNTFLLAGYNSSNGFKIRAVQTNGGTSFNSLGSTVSLAAASSSGGQWENLESSVAWNPNQSRAICLHPTSNSSGATWSLLSLSGTTLTKVSSGSVPGTSNTSRGINVSCSKTDGQVVASWHETSDIAGYVVGTISGNSVSWGSPVTYTPTRNGSQTITSVRVAYNSSKGGFASEIYLRDAQSIVGNWNTVTSGNSITTGSSDFVSYTGSGDWFYTDTSMKNRNRLVYEDGWYIGSSVNSQYKSVITRNVYAEGSLIGLANSSASANATVKVTTLGGVNTSQSGLSAGTVYGLSKSTGLLDESVSPEIGRALSSTDFYLTGLVT